MRTEDDLKVVEAMIRFGGGFVKALGQAFEKADETNFNRLKEAFPEYWADYAKKKDWLPGL